MARTDTLGHYLSDIADAIRTKGGTSASIQASAFDTAIANLPSGGASGIYKVATIVERDALTNVQEGDVCIVYARTLGDWSSTSSSNIMMCPSQVILSEAYSSYANTSLRDSNYELDLNLSLDEYSFRIDGYGNTIEVRVEYHSEDGITYDRQMFDAMDFDTGSLISGDTITFPVEVSCDDPSRFDSTIGKFIQTTSESFGGIYIYINNTWNDLNLGVSANAGDIVTGKNAYTNSGLTSGTFGSTFNKDYMVLYSDIVNSVGAWQPTGLRRNDYSPQSINTYSVFGGYTGTDLLITKLLDTSNVTDFRDMFVNCTNLTSLDLSNFDVSKGTRFDDIFKNCSSLTTLDLSNFDTSQVSELSVTGLFCDCSSLTSVVFGNNFNTSKAYSFNAMFAGCSSLVTLTLPAFNCNSLQSMSYMFRDCSSLISLDLSKLSSYRKITSFAGMFNGCTSLQTIDIRNIDLTKCTSSSSYKDMFGSSASTGVPNNCLIIVKDSTNKSWVTSKFSRLTNVKTPSEL